VATRALARGRAACACALVAAAVAGCSAASSGSAGSSVTISGKVLTIYLSNAPTDQPTVARDVLDAERLAWSQSSHDVGSFALRLVVLHGQISDQARTAIQDKTAIAYVGEVVPHSSYASLGITNALDLLQVSPTDNAVELTQASPAVPGSPDIYYESLSSYGKTFARLVPTSALEAKAQVSEMQSLGVTKLYVADDGSPYGAAIAYALKHDLSGSISLASSEASADGIFYGSASEAGAARFFATAAGANPSAKLFGPSALADPSFPTDLSSAVRNLYISAPGFLKQDLPPAGSTFVSQFDSAYGHAPVGQAIFGYEAMSALLAVLKQAGTAANNRSTVIKDFQTLRRSGSVLGSYSMNGAGDTSIAPFVFSRLAHGSLVPFAQVQG
jgi:ABC-type branched-subunit amino acid transport system substrate-binding protein